MQKNAPDQWSLFVRCIRAGFASDVAHESNVGISLPGIVKTNYARAPKAPPFVFSREDFTVYETRIKRSIFWETHHIFIG
jgi:hypothetical protein